MEIEWDSLHDRRFSEGLERVVLYVEHMAGVPWDGVTSITEAPANADANSRYFEGYKIFKESSVEHFAGTIEAYSYPKEFERMLGIDSILTGQQKDAFGFTYRTTTHHLDDTNKTTHQTHIVYNVLVEPSDKTRSSYESGNEPDIYSWSFVTHPESFEGVYGAHIIVDEAEVNQEAFIELLKILYGTDTTTPRLPTPTEVIELFDSYATLRIKDNRDGTWTATGPDEAIVMLTSTMFEITWPSAIFINDTTYRISSL